MNLTNGKKNSKADARSEQGKQFKRQLRVPSRDSSYSSSNSIDFFEARKRHLVDAFEPFKLHNDRRTMELNFEGVKEFNNDLHTRPVVN